MTNCLEDLKRAWEGRKSEVEARLKALGGTGLFAGGGGYGGMYGGNPAQQYAQLERVSTHFLSPLRIYGGADDNRRWSKKLGCISVRATAAHGSDLFLTSECLFRYHRGVVFPDGRGVFRLPPVR